MQVQKFYRINHEDYSRTQATLLTSTRMAIYSSSYSMTLVLQHDSYRKTIISSSTSDIGLSSLKAPQNVAALIIDFEAVLHHVQYRCSLVLRIYV